MSNVPAQTPEELVRECYGTIWRAANEMSRAAENQDGQGVHVMLDFLRVQVARLDTIRKNITRNKR